MKREPSLTLMAQSADQNTIEKLYAQNFINQQGKDYALRFLISHLAWREWGSMILSYVSMILVLSGLACVLYARWQMMTKTHQISTIFALVICGVFTAWYFYDSKQEKNEKY